MRRIVLLLFCALPILSFSQTPKGKIILTATNEQNNPLESVTAELIKEKDSSLVKVALSDNTGKILFENISSGSYRIRLSFAGHNLTYSNLFSITDIKPEVALPTISLTSSSNG